MSASDVAFNKRWFLPLEKEAKRIQACCRCPSGYYLKI
jgi:hypothetical protein